MQARFSAIRFLMGFLLMALAGMPRLGVAQDAHRNLAATTAFLGGPQQAAVIVKYKENGMWSQAARGQSAQAPLPKHAQKINKALGLNTTDGRVLDPHIQSLRAKGLSSQDLASRLRQLPDVEWVEVDKIRRIHALPNDPYLADNLAQTTPHAGQWYLRSPTNQVASAINAVGAWGITTGNPNVVVAVLDTGVRMEHPDLRDKLVSGYDFIADVFTGNDGNGRDKNANDPGDWHSTNDCGVGDPAESSSWHGTQVAGLIGAATNNATGIAGVGYNVRILPVRVLGRCGGYDSDIIAGMLWAAGMGAYAGFGNSVLPPNPYPSKILNLSLGGSGACSNAYKAVLQKLTQAQVAVVVSAGNSSAEVGEPANCPGVISVAGLRHSGTKAGFSSLGPEVSISAPGGNCVNTNPSDECLYPIMSTTNLGDSTPGANGYSDGYARAAFGTSFAAPLVAGTIGLMRSVQPTLDLQSIKTQLLANVSPFPLTSPDNTVTACLVPTPNSNNQLECLCNQNTCGAGMLNTQAAVAAVAPPSVTITPSALNGPAGGYITLNATGTRAMGSKSIRSYTWSISRGNGLAVFSGLRSGNMATLALKTKGEVVVSLKVTDSLQYTTTQQVKLNITP